MVRGPWRSKGAGGCSDGDAEGRWDTGARTRRRRALSWWRTWVWDPQRPRGTPALPVCPPKALGDTCCPRPSPEGPGGHLLSPSVPRRPWGTPAPPVRPPKALGDTCSPVRPPKALGDTCSPRPSPAPLAHDEGPQAGPGASAPVSLLESLVSCVLGLLHRFCPARITDLQSDQRN